MINNDYEVRFTPENIKPTHIELFTISTEASEKYASIMSLLICMLWSKSEEKYLSINQGGKYIVELDLEDQLVLATELNKQMMERAEEVKKRVEEIFKSLVAGI